jgi:HAMP domain-containing protein
MMNDRRVIEINTIQYWIGVAVLILSLLSSVSSIGYFVRRVADIDTRLSAIETNGSVAAQLTAKDISWLNENMKRITEQLDRVESKLDRHVQK